ncbi:hypothetical protein [Microbacterium jejuense]|uniref:hypothetical protein n=1 Tax=Microbacterium jejuense TaxID=1263637 RepID=UPI0031F00426
MNKHHPPNEQTPDQQRAARDKRWAEATGMHWHKYVPTAETQARADEEDRIRGAKPTDVPSQPPDTRN